MKIRPYHAEDCPVLLELFRGTVYNVNSRDYSPEQVAAWVGCVDPARWAVTLAEHVTLVAEIDGVVVGFGDNCPGNRLPGQAVCPLRLPAAGNCGCALCDRLEPLSRTGEVYSDVSVTAEPFFAARGYQVVRRQLVERCGVLLPNCKMLRKLTSSIER